MIKFYKKILKKVLFKVMINPSVFTICQHKKWDKQEALDRSRKADVPKGNSKLPDVRLHRSARTTAVW